MKKIIPIIRTVLFFGVGFAILYLVYLENNAAYMDYCALEGIPSEDCSLIEKVKDDFASAKYIWIVVILFMFMISNVARALRWHQLLKPLGYQPKLLNSFFAIMVGYLTNLGLPRAGEFVRAGLLAKYEDYEAEKVMGTIVTDRIVDLLSLLFVFLLSLLFAFNPIIHYFDENLDLRARFSWLLDHPMAFSLLGIAGIVLMILIYRYRNPIRRSGIGMRLEKAVRGLFAGIASIRKLENVGLFLFYSFIIWLMYYLMVYLAFFAYAPTATLGPIAGLVVFVFGTLGMVFPSPGGMGSYHLLIGEGLAIYGISGIDAFSFANIVFFSVQLFCNLFFGLVSLILLPIYNEKK